MDVKEIKDLTERIQRLTWTIEILLGLAREFGSELVLDLSAKTECHGPLVFRGHESFDFMGASLTSSAVVNTVARGELDLRVVEELIGKLETFLRRVVDVLPKLAEPGPIRLV
jgi:hypothetical protein